MRRVLFLTLLLSACAQTAPVDHNLPADVIVVPDQKGRMLGGEATYVVNAPQEVMKRVILDFESQGSYRPMIVSANSLFANEDGGTVLFRFRGELGIEPQATCRYRISEDGDDWRLDFEMKDPGLALRGLAGSFTLTPVREDRQTLVKQQFLVSAIMMDRARLLAELEEDARAIREHAESLAGAILNR